MTRPISPDDLHGSALLGRVAPLLDRLRPAGTDRDRAGNRGLFYDQYVALLLLYFFNPILTSLRGLQQATTLEGVQKRLGIRRQSLGSLSEATGVFDPELVRGIVADLARQIAPAAVPADREALRHLTAVDGSLLPALPRMAWALWQDDTHRAAKVHLHFEVARGVPVDATVTPAQAAEATQLRQALRPGRLYVLDRGYASYALLADILAAGSSFVARLRDDAAFRVSEDRGLTPGGIAAGVLRDVVIDKLGTGHHKDHLGRPVRLVVVGTDRPGPDGGATGLTLCTDRLDLPAELVALAYRQRWQVELFFRWLKGILGCRHLLSQSLAGVTIQVYVALIASLLVTATSGRKPTKRTFEMLCLFFAGWASEAELLRHLDTLDDST
jgi:hypothetical protein